jgi:hypothetical protein
VADIVRQAERFGEVLVQAQRTGDGATNLGDFQAVGEPNPKMIPVGCDKDLSFMSKSPERD